MSGLVKLIDVDQVKCVTCRVCISACPVKYCNDGTDDQVAVNKDLCSGYGACSNACTWELKKKSRKYSVFPAAWLKLTL